MALYFILWIIIQCYAVYLVAQIIPALATGGSFIWLLCPSDTPTPIILPSEHFLTFCHCKMLQANLVHNPLQL